MLVVGLTGGIGCGKSYVAAKMQLHGIPVYDSDSHAKLLTYADPFIKSYELFIVQSNSSFSGGRKGWRRQSE